MTDLRHFDIKEEFTAVEAAALIAGVDPKDTHGPQHLAVPALARLTEAYEHARRQCSQPMTVDEFKAWRGTAAFAHALASARVECYVFNQKQPLWVRPRLVGTDPRIDLCGPLPPGINGFYVEPGREWELPKLFQGEYGDLEQQRFNRAELLRWLAAIDQKSVYDFSRTAGAASQADTQEEIPPSDLKAETVQELPMKLAALVKAYKAKWPTIERDIKDARDNGLRDFAGAGSRDWFASKALAWADSKGKLNTLPEPALDQILHGRG